MWSDLAGCLEFGNYTNGSGDVACVSSDMFGPAEFDTELITPQLNFAASAGATLSFTANYQNYLARDFFEVDVSTTGTFGPWTNVLSWNESHGAFFSTPGEDVVVDLSAYDGVTSVWIRFHYYDPNAGDWDWYVQIDDVAITGTFDCTLTDGISNGSFETGDFSHWCIEDLDSPFDPLAVVADGTSGSWGFFTSTATDGAFLARHGFDGDGPGTIALKQQVTIPSTAAQANLTFDWRGAWDLFAGPTMDRSLDVIVEPAGGGAPLATSNIFTTDYAVTPMVGDTGQQSALVDLSGFAGASVLIGLVSTIPENFTGPANLDIDNVALDVNNNPVVTAPIPDMAIGQYGPDVVIDLTTVFTELDGEMMTFSATSSDPSTVTAVVGSPLTLSGTATGTGSVSVTATATDPNGFSESDVFMVTSTFGDDVGLVDTSQGIWYLRDTDTGVVNSFFYGNPVDLPIAGDWDGDGDATPGLYRQSDGFFYARNSNTQGPADANCFAGNPEDVPVAGDWDGDGDDTLGIYRPSEQVFYLFNKTCNNAPMGAAAIAMLFGNPGDTPVAGDWDADGIDEVGLFRESTGFFYWRNTLTTGPGDGSMFFGDPNDRFVGGEYGILDGIDTPAIFRPGDATFYFRHTLTQGIADSQFPFGNPAWLPVAGDFSP